jgi:hypothetical protein
MPPFQQHSRAASMTRFQALNLQVHILESKLGIVLLLCNLCHHYSKSSRSARPTRLDIKR